MVKSSILAGLFLAAAVTTPALAFQLTPADFGYLETLGVERNSPIMRDLSPRQEARLHNIINADWAKNNPEKRAGSVREALMDVVEQREWEKNNPGKLWDSSKQK